MSNKRVNKQEKERTISEKKKTIIFLCCLIILCIAFLGVWIDVMNKRVLKC